MSLLQLSFSTNYPQNLPEAQQLSDYQVTGTGRENISLKQLKTWKLGTWEHLNIK